MKADVAVRILVVAMVVLGVGMVGCSRPTSDGKLSGIRFAAKEGSALYPHSDAFKNSRAHGEEYLRSAGACISCHGEQLDGGVAKSRSCTSCHEAYPHTAEFKLSNAHGLVYRSSPEQCTSCHGEQLDGGPSKLNSCNQCHAAYPHTEEFKLSMKHGEAFLQNKDSCLGCHTSSPAIAQAKGDTKASCQSCHSYPHEAKWSIRENHGTAFVQKQESCTQCHGETSSFRSRNTNDFVSCGSCHVLLPHSKKFKNGSKEHKAAAQSAEGKCTSCHTDYKRLMPDSDDVGCFSCHDDTKVLKVQWVDVNPTP